MKKNKKPYYIPLKIGKRVRSPFSDIVKIKTKSNGQGALKAVLVFGIIAFQILLFIVLHFIKIIIYFYKKG